jgi:DNA invertase Pin-like site-specific DNA recombinase
MPAEPPIPAVQYLRMSTEHQQYSLEYQAFIISSYAAKNNFIIIRSYTDAAKSGLALKDRTGLAELLRDVVSSEHAFKVVLVYDVSRWGRFQDADEGAHYEFICRQAGVQVHYCAETFANDGTMPSAITKALKRVMAAEYSRDLSERTTMAIARLVRDGFWGGASPGYGLRRMLVGKDGQRKRVMNVGERKALHDEHTILVPGPSNEIMVIKEIFRLYTDGKRSMSYIARRLNELGILRGTVRWNYNAVRKILFGEKYSGSLVWRRYTQKLKSRYVPLPETEWVVAKDVIAPIVDRGTFDAARVAWSKKTNQLSDECCLDRLRDLLHISGRLNARLINESPLTPSSCTYAERFGSLTRAYQLIGYARTDTFIIRHKSGRQITQIYRSLYRRLRKLFPDIRAMHERINARPKTLRFSTGLRVAIAICHLDKTLRGEKRWRFECRYAQRSGLVTLLCFSKAEGDQFGHFIVMPKACHIPVVSLLKEFDERLASGVRLKALREFRRAAHRFGRVSNESPSMRLGRSGRLAHGLPVTVDGSSSPRV